MTTTTLHSADLADIIDRAHPWKLSTSALSALLRLHSSEGGVLSMTALAKAIRSSSANITGIIDRLEASGLVSRAHSRCDRRVIWIHLTPKGTAAVETILADN